jgi:hypothetical protein
LYLSQYSLIPSSAVPLTSRVPYRSHSDRLWALPSAITSYLLCSTLHLFICVVSALHTLIPLSYNLFLILLLLHSFPLHPLTQFTPSLAMSSCTSSQTCVPPHMTPFSLLPPLQPSNGHTGLSQAYPPLPALLTNTTISPLGVPRMMCCAMLTLLHPSLLPSSPLHLR